MNLLSKGQQAFERGGISEVVSRGINLTFSRSEKAIMKRTPFEIPYFVRRHSIKAKKSMNTLTDKGIGPRITEVPLKDYKSSETLFILGSGTSINNITEEEWEHIDQHDSIGLNRWAVHDFLPTYYVFEMRLGKNCGPDRKKFNEKFWNLLTKKKEEYKNIPIILKDQQTISKELELSHLPEWLQGQLIISCDSNFRKIVGYDSSVEMNERLLFNLKENGYFDPEHGIRLLYRKRGSMSYLLHLSTLLGYKNIVLCGVDMVDSLYFFDEKRDYYKANNIPIPKINETSYSKPHPTNDPDRGKLTLQKVIYSMNDIILDEYEIDLYVENKKSALHPRIPVYNYSQ